MKGSDPYSPPQAALAGRSPLELTADAPALGHLRVVALELALLAGLTGLLAPGGIIYFTAWQTGPPGLGGPVILLVLYLMQSLGLLHLRRRLLRQPDRLGAWPLLHAIGLLLLGFPMLFGLVGLAPGLGHAAWAIYGPEGARLRQRLLDRTDSAALISGAPLPRSGLGVLAASVVLGFLGSGLWLLVVFSGA
jgi:hypothetical protein